MAQNYFVLYFFFLLMLCTLFHKKLIFLLCGEMIMILYIYLFLNLNFLNSQAYFLGLLLAVFLVLDSVFSISCLISSSRSSSLCNHFSLKCV